MADTAQATEEKTEEAQDQQTSDSDSTQSDSKTTAQSVEFSEAAQTSGTGPQGNIDILLDMNVPVTVVVGKKEIPVRRLLQLGPGSVLQLEKSIDEPADLYLKDTKFAVGNVVVVDGQFAVRIKQILGLDNSAEQSSAP